jgi:ubiquinone/menaquinone biosynthesis C-methylase UbiE
LSADEGKMVLDLTMWETHRHEKGAEIVNQAGPYGPGPWLELGSGIGNNTIPLSKKVDTLIALDVSNKDLLKLQQKTTLVYPLQADFRALPFRTNSLGGIFTSFSVHFVKEHNLVFREITRVLRSDGTLILVEYRTSESVPWIPFPLPQKRACQLLHREGFPSPEILHETPRYYVLHGRKKE